MLPEVQITAACLGVVSAELDRVAPCEGLLVPLLTLTPRDPRRNPCADLGLEDIGLVCVAAAVRVPPRQQLNAPARVGVRPDTDAALNAEVAALLARYPRLRACGHLHSHPFAVGATRPSGGPCGDVEGHMRPQQAHNRRAGLDTSFSFIACRAPAGGWRLQAFALDRAGEVVDLGFAATLDDPVAVHQEHLVPTFQERPLLHGLLCRWHAELERRGLRLRHDELFDGWQRTLIEVSPTLTCAVLIPLRFPAQAARCFVVERPGGRTREHPCQVLSSLRPHACLALVDEVQERTHVCN